MRAAPPSHERARDATRRELCRAAGESRLARTHAARARAGAARSRRGDRDLVERRDEGSRSDCDGREPDGTAEHPDADGARAHDRHLERAPVDCGDPTSAAATQSEDDLLASRPARLDDRPHLGRPERRPARGSRKGRGGSRAGTSTRGHPRFVALCEPSPRLLRRLPGRLRVRGRRRELAPAGAFGLPRRLSASDRSLTDACPSEAGPGRFGIKMANTL